MNPIDKGRYTLVYPDGQYRTIWIHIPRQGRLKGAKIVKIKDGNDWIAVGTLKADNKIAFWYRWYKDGEITVTDPRKQPLIQKAVDRIAADPEGTGMAFALRENCCYRCGLELTVPASIHRGMGPECAKKAVTKKDNKQVYDIVAVASKHRPHDGMCNLSDPVCKAFTDMRIAQPGWMPKGPLQGAQQEFGFHKEARSKESL